MFSPQPGKRTLLCMCVHVPPVAYTGGSYALYPPMAVQLLFLCETGIAIFSTLLALVSLVKCVYQTSLIFRRKIA